jgi:hypothetical protein
VPIRKNMSKISKIVVLLAILNGIVLTSMADRGIGKNKKKVVLNLASGNTSISRALSITLKSGLKYRGTLLNSVVNKNNLILYSTLVTYQKGNTIYVIPYKQKLIVPEMKQGYTGMKLIIKPKL